MDQHKSIVELANHFGGAVDEVRGNVSLIELHAVYKTNRCLGCFALFNGNHAILSNLLESLREQIANCTVVIGADRANLRNLFGTLHLLCHFHQPAHCGSHSLLDAAADGHRVTASGNHASAFAEDCAGQNRGCCRAVACQVGRFGSHFIHEFRAHVFKGVFQVHFLAHRHAVLGDRWAAKRLVDDDIAAGWPHGHCHGGGEFLDTLQQFGASVVIEQQLFGHESLLLRRCRFHIRMGCLYRRGNACERVDKKRSKNNRNQFKTFARMSVSRRIFTSWPSISISLPEYLP